MQGILAPRGFGLKPSITRPVSWQRAWALAAAWREQLGRGGCWSWDAAGVVKWLRRERAEAAADRGGHRARSSSTVIKIQGIGLMSRMVLALRAEEKQHSLIHLVLPPQPSGPVGWRWRAGVCGRIVRRGAARAGGA